MSASMRDLMNAVNQIDFNVVESTDAQRLDEFSFKNMFSRKKGERSSNDYHPPIRYTDNYAQKPFGSKGVTPVQDQPKRATQSQSTSITDVFHMLNAIKKNSPSSYEMLIAQIKKEYSRSKMV